MLNIRSTEMARVLRSILKEMGIFSWKVSDCEELVGVFTEDGEVGLVKKYNIRVHRLCVRALRSREAKIVPILCH